MTRAPAAAQCPPTSCAGSKSSAQERSNRRERLHCRLSQVARRQAMYSACATLRLADRFGDVRSRRLHDRAVSADVRNRLFVLSDCWVSQPFDERSEIGFRSIAHCQAPGDKSDSYASYASLLRLRSAQLSQLRQSAMVRRAALLAVAAACGTTHAFRVAVVQHQVVTADTDDGTISANLDKYANATSQAAAAGAQLVVFPEFALGMNTGACVSAQTPSAFCEPVSWTPADWNLHSAHEVLAPGSAANCITISPPPCRSRMTSE